MSKFNKYIKSKISEERGCIPNSVKLRIEQALEDLPEKNPVIKKIRILPRIAMVAACLIFIMIFFMPNVSVAYAQALEEIPVIGDIIRVVTIRNYFYTDDRHEMNIDVPKIEGENGEAVDYINKDVSELTAELVNLFYKELELSGNNGYGSIYVDYEVVSNTDRWFTLKLSVMTTVASNNHYFKFYHIDKEHGEIIELGDIFNTDEFSDVLVAEIKKQMQNQMSADDTVAYWINDIYAGEEFSAISSDHNFYWNSDGNLVIVFDKHEVAPGSMGTPEFVIEKTVVKDVLKSEYANINS